MVDDNDWSTLSSRTETVKGRRLQEVLKTRQGSDLRNKVFTIIQKFLLFYHRETEWLHLFEGTHSTIAIIVRYDRQDLHLEFLIDRLELVCQMWVDHANL